jgi:N-acetylneuraminic acid mutarotase
LTKTLFRYVKVVLIGKLKMGEQKTALTLLLILGLVLSTIPLVRAAEDTWVSKEPMPFGCSGVAEVNDKIYAIGTMGIAEYDPTIDTWTIKESMPTPRTSFGIAVIENKIYIIGGTIGFNSTTQEVITCSFNQVYDPITDSWETKEPMPTNRSQLDANVVDGKIYLIGGRTGGQYTTAALNQVYDPKTDTWTTKEPIPYPVVEYASAVVDGKIYVIGGQDEFNNPMNLDLTQIYDPETDTWIFGTSIPNVVWQAAAGATTGEMAPKRIYVMGGLPQGSLYGTDLNQIYDVATDTWTLGTHMPTARAQLHVAVVNDVLYSMGGLPFMNVQATPSLENYLYTPVGYIPEFPSWIILILLITATLVVMIARNKLVRKGLE